MTSIQQIHEAITKLGIEGSSVVVHSSLRSFGGLEGGTKGLIEVLRRCFTNVMMPAFSTTFITRPPLHDRPRQNGCDYSDESLWQLNASEAFDFKKMIVDPRMGRLAGDFAQSEGVYRSSHPWHSWSIAGENAERWTQSHPWERTHTPLEELIKANGFVLLMGVDLRSCTAIHVAEERVGRAPFIRWARNREGFVERIRVSGCAKGFHFLEPALEHVVRKIQVGESLWRVARMSDLVEESVRAMRKNPEITRCSSDCLRCRDVIAGGVEEK